MPFYLYVLVSDEFNATGSLTEHDTQEDALAEARDVGDEVGEGHDVDWCIIEGHKVASS